MKRTLLLSAAIFIFFGPATASANLIEITGAGELDGTWEIALHEDSFNSLEELLLSQVWWGDDFLDFDLAEIFADALGAVSGVNNFGYGLGPLFPYFSTEDGFYFSAWSDGTTFPLGAGSYTTAYVGGRFEESLVYATAVKVPEPGTILLLGFGLLIMGLARRRHKT